MKTGEAPVEVQAPGMRAHRQFDIDGLNSGAPADLFGERFITPTELFFTRTHAAIPAINPTSWRLQVDGLVARRLELSLES